jgi:hypothetical protein
LTRAVLKQEGKVDSVRHRLIKVVIGGRRVSRHDFRIAVGMKSNEHVASEDDRIAVLTSVVVAGLN